MMELGEKVYGVADVIELAQHALEREVSPFPGVSTFLLIQGPAGDHRYVYTPQDRDRLIQVLLHIVLEVERSKFAPGVLPPGETVV